MFIPVYKGDTQAFSNEIIGDFILFTVSRDVNFLMLKDRFIDGICKTGFIRCIEIRKKEYFITGIPVHIECRFNLHGSFSKGAGFIGADNVHASEILDGRKPLDDHLLLSHFFGSVGKVYADNSW